MHRDQAEEKGAQIHSDNQQPARGWDFPGGQAVKTPRFHCRGTGSTPTWGTKIPHALWLGQKVKQTNNNNKKHNQPGVNRPPPIWRTAPPVFLPADLTRHYLGDKPFSLPS